jgi:hypothetical protein
MDDVTETEPRDNNEPTATYGEGNTLLRRLHGWYRNAVGYRRTFATETETDEKYAHNKQWTAEEINTLKETGREPITLPHITKVIWSMLGFRAQNKYEVKYSPRGASDVGLADARTQLAKYVWDQNHAEFRATKATTSQYICGIGWLFVGYQYDDPQNEPIKIADVNWSEMAWDPRSVEDDFSDAEFINREKWLTLDTAKRLYPEHADHLDAYARSRSYQSETFNAYGFEAHDVIPGDQYGSVATWQDRQFYRGDTQEVRVVECWYRVKESGHYIKFPDGTVEVFNRFDQKHQLAGMLGARVMPGTINRVKFATFCGDLLLEEGDSPYEHGYFPYVPYWGIRDERGRPYGMVRLLRDAQKVTNWGLSKVLWTAQSGDKPIIGPDEDVEDVRENVARPDGILREKQPNGIRFATGLNSNIVNFNQLIIQMGMEAMEQIGGSPAEMRGDESNAKSGRAIIARQEAAVRQQMVFLDQEKRSLTQIGEMLSSMFDQSYTDEKVLRITEPDGRTGHVAINVQDPLRRQQLAQMGLTVYGDVSQDRYDVTVEATAMTSTRRQAFAEEFGQIMSTLPPQYITALLPGYIRSLDAPNAEAMATTVEQVNEQQQQAMQAQAQAEDQRMQAQMMGDQAKAMDAERRMAEAAQGMQSQQMLQTLEPQQPMGPMM